MDFEEKDLPGLVPPPPDLFALPFLPGTAAGGGCGCSGGASTADAMTLNFPGIPAFAAVLEARGCDCDQESADAWEDTTAVASAEDPTEPFCVGGSGGKSVLYGDGSDGDAVITNNTTLTRPWYYNNLTIRNSAVLNTGGFPIYVRRILTIEAGSSLSAAGGAGGSASGATGGTAGTAGGAATQKPLLAIGGAGGTGMTSTGAGTANGAGAPAIALGNQIAFFALVCPNELLSGRGGSCGGAHGAAQTGGTQGASSLGASGGGGKTASGVGNSSVGGGGGGGGGGILLLYAYTINNAGTILADGGAGGAGATSGGDSGGGGGGGGGGVVMVTYTIPTGSGVGTLSAAAGAAGSGGTGGSAASAGKTMSVQVSVT